METRAKIYCDQCEEWLELDPAADPVSCACGQEYLVTVTALKPRLGTGEMF